MKYEYLLFNLFIISGPLILSMTGPWRHLRKWIPTLAGTVLPMIPFIGWDILVTGRHWWFNAAYTLPFQIGGLPPGEWLFFLSVPFSCLFVWEAVKERIPAGDPYGKRAVVYLVIAILPLSVWLFVRGLEYTALSLFALAVAAAVDQVSGVGLLLQRRTYVFLAIITALILGFNGYLTARPIVLYGIDYQLDFRIFTIPIEDFGYGLAHLLLCATTYEITARIITDFTGSKTAGRNPEQAQQSEPTQAGYRSSHERA